MNVDGDKIKGLMEAYGKSKGYPEKSYVSMFCEDNNVNYNQWNAYTRGAQNVGTKIIQLLIEVFPNLNLNWLLKEDTNMFVSAESQQISSEPEAQYSKEVTNSDIYKKLEDMHHDIKKRLSK